MEFCKKLTKYLILLCLLSAFGVIFCKSTLFFSFRHLLVNYFPFYYLKGENEFISNLLIGISTSAFFAALGFLINYFEIKKKRQEQLIAFYIKMRRSCFENIFYEKNYYDDKFDEVDSIFDYLNENKNTILDYRPPFLLFKTKVRRIFTGRAKENNGLFQYTNYNKYAIIVLFFSDMYTYFSLIHMYHCSIRENNRMIKLFKSKKRKALSKYNQYIEKSDKFKAELAEAEINGINKCLTLYKNLGEIERKKLVSRYPFNNTKFQSFTNKRDLLSKCFAIDSKFKEYICSYYIDQLSGLDETIVYDSSLLFEPNDERLKI